MKTWERWLIFAVIVVLTFFVVDKICDALKPIPNAKVIKVTDTAYVKEIITLQPINNTHPEKVIIQKEADTVYRERVEKETIITGATFDSKHNEITLQKIDSLGKRWEEHFKIEEGSTAIIDNKNFEEKKKTKVGKFLQKAKKGIIKGLAVVGVVAIVITATK
jgi:hypothetical protein